MILMAIRTWILTLTESLDVFMYLRINGEGFDDGKGKGPSRLVQAGKALKTFTVLKAGDRRGTYRFWPQPDRHLQGTLFRRVHRFFAPESGGNN
jgi:hypothetical protein